MNLHTSFEYLLQELAVVMTQPSFQNFVTIVTGWIFARRRTVTGMLVAAGVAGKRHHSPFHRFFAEGAWSLDGLGLAVFRMLEPLLSDQQILVAIDDTGLEVLERSPARASGIGHRGRAAAGAPTIGPHAEVAAGVRGGNLG